MSEQKNSRREGSASPRVRRTRRQIAQGTYLTKKKVDVAVERLHEEIFCRGKQRRGEKESKMD